MLNALRLAGIAILATFFSGCASDMEVRPEIEPQSIENYHIVAKIVFDGNRDYLPRVLQDSPSGKDAITIEYRYDISHTSTNHDAVALFNPLSIVGFPSGNNQLNLLAELKILRNGELVKNYRAACAIETQTGLWSFRTLTEMRRDGLLALRDNIEFQLVKDRTNIEKMMLARE